ncbi:MULTISPECIES: hypothetical protein [Providencia]|uniref:hypothetical protein n=1 Tax=Providencia TaxID=586 RepID=UPI00224033B4|nr:MULTISPECIES: hypothetical protein [Providencia]
MSIGIFWLVDNEIIGFKSNLSLLNVDSIGMIDSDYQHVRDWAKLNISVFEYKHFPRGRVVFDTNIKKYIICLDEKLNTLFTRGKICEFFDIRNGENVIFKKVSYYVS